MIAKVHGYPPILVSSFTAFTSSNGAQVTTIQTVADVAGSLNNKYFILPSANNATIYIVWMNVNGAGVAPKIENTTNVEITLATNATANDVAGELRTVINALVAFSTGGATNECIITFATDGRALLAHDDSVVSGTSTGFTFVDTTPGTNAVPADLLYKIEGKIMKDQVQFDASVTGTLKQMRYVMENIVVIIPSNKILEVSTY